MIPEDQKNITTLWCSMGDFQQTPHRPHKPHAMDNWTSISAMYSPKTLTVEVRILCSYYNWCWHEHVLEKQDHKVVLRFERCDCNAHGKTWQNIAKIRYCRRSLNMVLGCRPTYKCEITQIWLRLRQIMKQIILTVKKICVAKMFKNSNHKYYFPFTHIV